VLSFEIAGGKDAARKVLDELQIVRPAVSFGGPETLICHPASSTHIGVATDAQIASGITDSMLRLSIGLEATSDIIADLQNALK
jgi:methionine-gamma-lyase